MHVTRGVLVLLAAIAWLAGGCTSNTPDGWTSVTIDGVELAHPEGWSAVETDALTERWVWGVAAAQDGEVTVELVATGGLAPVRYADVATTTIIANAQLFLPEFAITAVREGHVAGAATTEVTSFTYRTEGGDLAEGVWIVAADPLVPYSAAVQLTAPDLDAQLVRDLEASMRLTGRPPTPDTSVQAGAGR